jgi:hypothetical protein
VKSCVEYLHLCGIEITFVKNIEMTITIEIDNPTLLPKLQSWLKRNNSKAKIVAEDLDFEKLDTETKRRIHAFYAAQESGEAVKLYSLEEIKALENGI